MKRLASYLLAATCGYALCWLRNVSVEDDGVHFETSHGWTSKPLR